MKLCYKCKKQKLFVEFNKCKSRKDGLQSACRDCQRARNYSTKELQAISKRKKEYYLKNKNSILKRNRKWRKSNLEYYKSYHKQYALKNRNKIRERQKRYVEKDKERWRTYKKQWDIDHNYSKLYKRDRRRADPLFRLAESLRARLCAALRQKRLKKHSGFYKIVGASLEEIKLHLEKQFQPGMCWDNWGKGKDNWQIDHIVPLCKAKNRKELISYSHYTNLQPLWYKDHLFKTSIDIKEKTN